MCKCYLSRQIVKSDAFRLGQEFAKHYPSSVADMLAYQQIHDKNGHGEVFDGREVFSGANFCNTQSNDVNTTFASENECHSISDAGTDSKRNKGGIDVRNHKLRKPTHVKYKGSQAKQSDDSRGETRNRKAACSRQDNDFSSYLDFSEWKSAFDGTRSITSWIQYLHLPTKVRFQSKREMTNETLDFMRGIMDECTHIGNFCTPVDTSLIIVVAAKHDAYVPRDSTLNLQQLWPGCEVRYVDTGHIAAFLTKQHIFRLVVRYKNVIVTNNFFFLKNSFACNTF